MCAHAGEEDLTVLLSENAAYQIYTKWMDTLKVIKCSVILLFVQEFVGVFN